MAKIYCDKLIQTFHGHLFAAGPIAMKKKKKTLSE